MLTIRWLGHAAVEIKFNGYKILIDPLLKDNPMNKVPIEEFKDVDLIGITHDHYDHLGDTLELMNINQKAKLIATWDLENFLNKTHNIPWERMIPANVGSYIDIDEVKVALTKAVHSSEHGDPTGIVIKLGSTTLYHAGDTGLFEDMKLIGELFSPDYAMLPSGGRFTMDPYQCGIAASMIKPKKAVIPIHYNTWNLIKVNISDFEKYVKESGFKPLILYPGQEKEL
ncbi:metal-dependent hydrolase [Sulfuracidifex metallicus]|uniref:metal-dependent hydrolase n=1 Tax=Sulfuracidifex metallicus TaxID=47303 RepID=UPI002276870B|nr:metal-dependent hydrolase [Sulfuracidifex metallicus]MCY0850184.1 metal-dependent hydrolase [Sulfuracidifex metallicus]